MHLPDSNTASPSVEMPAPGVTGPSTLGGSWAAVRWEYARRDGTQRTDIVSDLGGTVTLSVASDAYVLSADVPPAGPRAAGGRILIAGEEWLDFAPQGGPPERVGFRRAPGTLVLRSDHAAWDFTGSGEEPADFTAVLVRL